MREGRELGGPHDSGEPRRRGVYLVRRVAAVLALLVVMVLVAPQAYKALVGSDAGSNTPAPGANGVEDPGPEELAEPVPPADAPEERAAEPAVAPSTEEDAAVEPAPAEPTEDAAADAEPAPAEPVKKDEVATPSEDDLKDEEQASRDEPAPVEPAVLDAENVSATVLVAEEQYAPVAQYDVAPTVAVEAQYAASEQYPVEAQYMVEDQYLAAEQFAPVLPEPVLPEPVLPAPVAPVEQVVEEAPLTTTPVPANEIPAPVDLLVAEPVQPVVTESVAPEAVQYTPEAVQYEPVVQDATQYVVPAAPVVEQEPFTAPIAEAVEPDIYTLGDVTVEDQTAGCGDSASSMAVASASSMAVASGQTITELCGNATASARSTSS